MFPDLSLVGQADVQVLIDGAGALIRPFGTQPLFLRYGLGALDLDYALSDDFFILLNASVDSLSALNIPVGQTLRVGFLQDAVGGHTVNISGGWIVGSPAPAIDTTGYALSVVVVSNIPSVGLVVAGAAQFAPDFSVSTQLAKTTKNVANAVNAMDFIPQRLHADIQNDVCLADLSDYLNAATKAAGVNGLVVFPNRIVRGQRIILYDQQAWVGSGILQQPSGSGEHLVIDNNWLTNNPINSINQLIGVRLKAASPTNSRSSTNYNTTGGCGWMLFARQSTLAAPVDGFLDWSVKDADGFGAAGVCASAFTRNGTQVSGTNLASLFFIIPTRFTNCGTALYCNGPVTDSRFGKISVATCGTKTGYAISGHTWNGWDFDGWKMFNCPGPLITADNGSYAGHVGGARNARFANGNLDLDLTAYRDPNESPVEIDIFNISVRGSGGGTGSLRLLDNEVRFNVGQGDVSPPVQHTYRIFNVSNEQDNFGRTGRVIHENSYDCDFPPPYVTQFTHLECFHLSVPPNAVGGSRPYSWRYDYTQAQKGNGHAALCPLAQTDLQALSNFIVQPATSALLQRIGVLAGSPLGIPRTSLYDALFGSIGSALLAKLDLFYLTAAADETIALVNLANPGTFDLTKVGGLTFVKDRGYTGNGSTGYLDTGANPFSLPNYVLNNGSLYCWTGDDQATDNSYAIGTVNGNHSRINPRTAAGSLATRSQSTGVDQTVADADSVGGFGFSRTQADRYTQYIDGAPVAVQMVPSTGLAGTSLLLLKTATFLSTRTIQGAFAGRGFSDSEMAQVDAAGKTFLSAIGAPI